MIRKRDPIQTYIEFVVEKCRADGISQVGRVVLQHAKTDDSDACICRKSAIEKFESLVKPVCRKDIDTLIIENTSKYQDARWLKQPKRLKNISRKDAETQRMNNKIESFLLYGFAPLREIAYSSFIN